MKNSFIVLLAMLPWMAAAQIEKGKIFTTAAIQYNSWKEETLSVPKSDSQTSDFSLNGSAGYFITPRIAAGLDLAFNSTVQKSGPGRIMSKTNNARISTGILGRWYQPLSDKFFLFVQGRVGFGLGKSEYTYSDPISENSVSSLSLSIGLQPGINFFVSERFALETSLAGFSWYKSKSKDSNGSEYRYSGFSSAFIVSNIYVGGIYFFRQL